MTTALRTAATSALAAQQLARPDSRVMALIGNGAQSEFQAIAFHRLCGIRELRVYDVDPQATAKLVRNLAAMPELADLRVVRTHSAVEACKGADIVTTVTADKRNAVILTPPMITAGMHINGVGGDCRIEAPRGEVNVRSVEGELVIENSYERVRVERTSKTLTIVGSHSDILAKELGGRAEIGSSYEPIRVAGAKDELTPRYDRLTDIRITGRHVVQLSDGTIALADFAHARIAATSPSFAIAPRMTSTKARVSASMLTGAVVRVRAVQSTRSASVRVSAVWAMTTR